MVDVAVKIVAIILGIVAGVWAFYALNGVIFALLALLGGIAVGILVYWLVVRLLAEVFGGTRV